MKRIQKLTIMLICLSMILINTSIPINIFAEENVDKTDDTSFETLETQILNSERWCGGTNDDLSVDLNVEKMWFLAEEDITLSYAVSNEEEITNFDYSSTGFNVIDIYVDSSDNSKINLELSCSDVEEEYILDLRVTVGEEDVDTSLYAINNQYGIFISEISTTNAYERYLEYAVTENIVTLEQAEAMWYDYLKIDEDIISTENAVVDNSEIAIASLEKGSICGELKWMDANGIEHPLRNTKVEIYYELLGIGILLDIAITNDNGYFSREIDCHDNVYIVIYAGDDNVKVGSGIFGWQYRIEDLDRYEVLAGETVTVSFPTITMTNDEGLSGAEAQKWLETKKAFQIAQAAIAARDYAKDMMEQNVSGVTIVFPSLRSIGSCYIPVLSCIAIESNDYSDWDVIMHEYGHHIEFILNIILYPPYEHYSSVNHSDKWGIDEGTRVAWGESWNTVFALMAQDYLITEGRLDNNIPTADDTKYTDNGNGYDLESSVSSYWKASRLGDACEQSIMAVLWNLYDNYDATIDTISISHEEWWNLTTESGKYRFSDRANRFYELYADKPEKIAAFAELLTHYKMAPMSPTVLNSADVSISTPPSLSWVPQGGSTSFPNNNFDVIIYDDSYNEILCVENLEVTSYTFNADDWNQALKDHGYTCNDTIDIYITVAGSRVEPQWFDSNFKTGPYYSKYLPLSITSKHEIIIEQYDSQYHKLICIGCGGEETLLSHNLEYVDLTDTHHTKTCSDCGYSVTESHSLTYTESDDNCHLVKCFECGYSYSEEHNRSTYLYWIGDKHAYKCKDCGYIYEDTLQSHSFDCWVYLNETTHKSECTCGANGNTTAPHAFTQATFPNLGPMICVGCGYTKMPGGSIGQIIRSINKVSVNGSYILHDGTIMLVEEDIEAYLNGTLVFYDKDKLPVIQ